MIYFYTSLKVKVAVSILNSVFRKFKGHLVRQ